MNDKIYKNYCEILESELIPAMGCTEPISIAFTVAKAREVLGEFPKKAILSVSPNIVKNTKSVTVPNTKGLRGLKAAFLVGLIAGDASRELEVISKVTDKDIDLVNEYMDMFNLDIKVDPNSHIFDIAVTLISGENSSYVRVIDDHTNICLVKKNDKVIFNKELLEIKSVDKSTLNIEDILAFAQNCNIDDVKHVLDRQIEYNMAIATKGIEEKYGANIGKTILASNPNCPKTKAKAYAAAGSDARMNGCELPVVINSGSGNQGMTASVPVIVYAQELNKTKEELYRALLVSNLVTIRLKTGIGTLSAYCGAISAGAGAGAGICYLDGGRFDEIAHTVVNTLAITSGIICDGAKASCAAKIATAVDNGIFGYDMYKQGNQFYAGDGIVKKGVEKTIESVSRLAYEGMKLTDKCIIDIMLEQSK